MEAAEAAFSDQKFLTDHKTLRIRGGNKADTLSLDPRAPGAFPFPFKRKNDAGSFALPQCELQQRWNFPC